MRSNKLTEQTLRSCISLSLDAKRLPRAFLLLQVSIPFPHAGQCGPKHILRRLYCPAQLLPCLHSRWVFLPFLSDKFFVVVSFGFSWCVSAVQVHGTSFSRVSRNVAYDVSGSAYYLEDGVEAGTGPYVSDLESERKWLWDVSAKKGRPHLSCLCLSTAPCCELEDIRSFPFSDTTRLCKNLSLCTSHLQENNLFEYNLAAFVHIIDRLSDYENGGGQGELSRSGRRKNSPKATWDTKASGPLRCSLSVDFLLRAVAATAHAHIWT